MQEIKNISLSKTTHAELSEIASTYISIIREHLSDHSFLIDLTAIIEPKINDLQAALVAIRVNSLTEEVSNLDQLRDDAFIIFRDMIGAFERTDNEKERNAYHQLWMVIQKTGTSLYREGYTEQSGILEALFLELDKETHQTAMGILGISSRYKKLKTAEEKFKSVYESRLKEDTEKNYPTLTESRTALIPLISDLTPTLRNVIRTLDKNNQNTNWVALINENNDKLMTQIEARKTRKANEKEEALK